LIGK
jgi:hypothetical protein